MAEKTDEEIIKEVGLEASDNDISDEQALEELSIKDDGQDDESLEEINNNELEPTNESLEPVEEDSKANVIENEDKDDEELINNKETKDLEEEIPVQKKQPKFLKY